VKKSSQPMCYTYSHSHHSIGFAFLSHCVILVVVRMAFVFFVIGERRSVFWNFIHGGKKGRRELRSRFCDGVTCFLAVIPVMEARRIQFEWEWRGYTVTFSKVSLHQKNKNPILSRKSLFWAFSLQFSLAIG